MAGGVDRPVAARASIGWSGLAVCALAVAGAAWTWFVVAVPALLARHRTPAEPVMAGLRHIGLSADIYAGYHAGLLVTFALLCTTVAGVVVWRRRQEPMAWLVALFLVLVGTVNAPIVEASAWRHPRLEVMASAANLGLVAVLVALLVAFPDGRAVPRWGAPAAVAAVGVLVITGWGSLGGELPGGWFLLLVLTVLGGLAAQVHRYRRVSDWERRQQTKWVVAATGIAVLSQVTFPVLASLPMLNEPGSGALIGELLGVTGVTAGFAVLAVSLGVAVLRHRLWAVDVVVNRTLVYGALTLGTLALYTGLVVAADAALGSWARLGSSAVAAAAVAALFAPTRDRVQRRVNRSLYGHRDEPYRVLSDLGRQLHVTVEPASVLQKLVDTVAAALKLPYVALSIDERGEAMLAETGTGGGDVVPFPLLYQGSTVGALLVAPRSPNEPFNRADRVLLEDLAVQAAAATAAVRLSDQVQQARQQRVLALEEERRRLRRDLHDGLGPALASMTLQAELARDLLQETPEEAERLLTELTHQLQASTAEIRRVAYGLRPPALDDLGLGGALQSFLAGARASGLVVQVSALGLPPLAAAVEVAAYRIVQESVTNTVRHAGATACWVAMSLDGDTLVVDVEDDGTGLTASDHHGIGLLSMRERAAELGGSCSVTERRGGGVRVHAELPHATAGPPVPA